MEFNGNRSIYLQLSDSVCEKILRRALGEGDKIPSVREMAVETEVNPNTVMRSYSYLQDRGIIHNQRGIGYFVSEGAHERTREMKTEEFVQNELPRVFHTMDLIGMSIEEFTQQYLEYVRERKNHEGDK